MISLSGGLWFIETPLLKATMVDYFSQLLQVLVINIEVFQSFGDNPSVPNPAESCRGPRCTSQCRWLVSKIF